MTTSVEADSSQGDQVIKLVVVDSGYTIRSHGWRIGVGRTSFYIKSLDDPTSFKISLHGPDAMHETSGFKMGYDRDDEKARALVVHTPGWLPVWFKGRLAEDSPNGSRHVVRLRFPWDIFHTATPPGGYPRIKTSEQGVRITSPGVPFATDIDFYVTQDAPYWPNEVRARADNAIMGPIINEANQYLTAVSVRANMFSSPSPALALGEPPVNRSDAVRGHGGCIDEDHDFAWIVEQWLSRDLLRRRDAAAMLRRERRPPAWSPDTHVLRRRSTGLSWS